MIITSSRYQSGIDINAIDRNSRLLKYLSQLTLCMQCLYVIESTNSDTFNDNIWKCRAFSQTSE